jgi:uncharacterized protein YciI
MFIILISYKKPLEIVDRYLAEHVLFLDKGYASNYFIASGRKNPRTGGVIISQLKDRDQLQNIIKQDPFFIMDLADYEIVEFTPTKFQKEFSVFI